MILQTNRLIIRPLEPSDFSNYHELNSDKRNLEFELFVPYSLDESESRFDYWLERNREFDGLIGTTEYCIEHKEQQKLIGVISSLFKDPNSKILEIGIMISYDNANHGYAFEALTAYIAYAFANTDVHRIYASTDTRNGSCIKLLEKLQMTREGVLRKNVLLPDGNYYDEAIYSILTGEII